MPKDDSLRDFYSGIKSAADLTALLAQDNMRDILLAPLSPARPESTLSYMVSDGYFGGFFSGDTPRKEFTAVVLDAIEKATADPAARLAALTGANALGQTPFHKALRFGGDLPVLEVLADRLQKWGGDAVAGAFLKNLMEAPLGSIGHDLSNTLQDVRSIRPWDSPEYAKIDKLCNDGYEPATFEGLRAAVDFVRPLVIEWLDKNPAAPKDKYQAGKNQQLRAFAEDPEAVKKDGTAVTAAFPGPVFDYFLDLQQKIAPLAPRAQAEAIFTQLSQPDAEGNTPMHRAQWQFSRWMGSPEGPGGVEDRLGTFIASLDRRLGTPVALELTEKLLLLENAKGELPLDNFPASEAPERDYYIGGFLQNLRQELGTQDKFKTYLKEVIASVLPSDYTISMATYEPEPPEEINERTGKPKPKRGAKLDF